MQMLSADIADGRSTPIGAIVHVCIGIFDEWTGTSAGIGQLSNYGRCYVDVLC